MAMLSLWNISDSVFLFLSPSCIGIKVAFPQNIFHIT